MSVSKMGKNEGRADLRDQKGLLVLGVWTWRCWIQHTCLTALVCRPTLLWMRRIPAAHESPRQAAGWTAGSVQFSSQIIHLVSDTQAGSAHELMKMGLDRTILLLCTGKTTNSTDHSSKHSLKTVTWWSRNQEYWNALLLAKNVQFPPLTEHLSKM